MSYTAASVTLPKWVKQARTLGELLVHMRDHYKYFHKDIPVPMRVLEFFNAEVIPSVDPSNDDFEGHLTVSGTLPTGVERAADLRQVTRAILQENDSGMSNIPMKFWSLFNVYLKTTPQSTERDALGVEIEKITATGENGSGSLNYSVGYPSGRTEVTWDLINAWYNWNETLVP